MIVDAETLRPRQRDRAPAGGRSDDGEIKPELMESVLEIATQPVRRHRRGGRAAARAARAACARRRPAPRPDDRLGRHASVRDVGGPADRRARRATATSSPRCASSPARSSSSACTSTSASTTPTRRSTSPTGCASTSPVLLALSANSPFWRARRDRACMSTRTPIFRAFPRVGIPPAYRDWDDYERADRVHGRLSGVMEDYTYLWYDVRPHPKFGTVEIRGLRLADARRAHARARRAHPGDGASELAEHYDAGGALSRLPVADARREQVARRAPRARRRARRPAVERAGRRRRRSPAGCWTACASTRRTSARPASSTAIEDLLERGNGAERQVVVYEANHDFREVMAEIVEATAPDGPAEA